MLVFPSKFFDVQIIAATLLQNLGDESRPDEEFAVKQQFIMRYLTSTVHYREVLPLGLVKSLIELGVDLLHWTAVCLT